MRILVAQFQIKEECRGAFTEACENVLSALSQEKPSGTRYTLCALPNGVSFIGLLEIEDGMENPLPGMEAGRTFLKRLPEWIALPVDREEWHVIGTYSSAQ